MKLACLALAAATVLSGCTLTPRVVDFADAGKPAPDYITNQLPADKYPGFMAAEGNIYSCRYGIHMQTRDEFNPSKEQVFATLLAKNLPGIEKHRVVLNRFDVYVNRRLLSLNNAGNVIGGAVGGAIASSGQVNADVFTFKTLIVDADPLKPKDKPNEHIVGCDHEQEGEYYASDISGGHSVVVTWLGFSVDSTPYTFKTYYQFQWNAEPNRKQQVVRAAVEGTFEAAARTIKLQ